MQSFFCQITDAQHAQLNDEETRHLKVLRIKEGEQIQCLDGKGSIYNCTVTKIGKDHTQLEIRHSTQISGFRDFRLHLYVAPTKNAERMEWLLEKAVETGLDSMTFIETDHSEKHRVNLTRMERIAISALKQSGQLYLPQINPLTEFKSLNPQGLVLFAHCAAGQKSDLKSVFKDHNPEKDIHVLIGPEGDFSKSEIESMYAKGYTAVTLGEPRLRTETAALYTVMVINALA